MAARILVGIIGGLAMGIMTSSWLSGNSDPPPRADQLTEQMKKKYKVQKNLGKGAFGTVFLVQTRTGKLFALKTIMNSADGTTKKEAQIMMSLRHVNVTQLYDLDMDTTYINMVMEYMEGGSLQDRLNKTKKMSSETVRLYFLQLCEAIDYLHEKNITHRDLKPDNILLASHDEHTLLKVSDFGLSRNHVEYYLTSVCGTKLFMPPEYWISYYQKWRFSHKVDIWSLGIILYKCITGDLPFPDTTAICKLDCPFNQQIWHRYPDAPTKIIEKMLKKNPTARPEISEIMENYWVADDEILELYAKIRVEFKNLS